MNMLGIWEGKRSKLASGVIEDIVSFFKHPSPSLDISTCYQEGLHVSQLVRASHAVLYREWDYVYYRMKGGIIAKTYFWNKHIHNFPPNRIKIFHGQPSMYLCTLALTIYPKSKHTHAHIHFPVCVRLIGQNERRGAEIIIIIFFGVLICVWTSFKYSSLVEWMRSHYIWDCQTLTPFPFSNDRLLSRHLFPSLWESAWHGSFIHMQNMWY